MQQCSARSCQDHFSHGLMPIGTDKWLCIKVLSHAGHLMVPAAQPTMQPNCPRTQPPPLQSMYLVHLDIIPPSSIYKIESAVHLLDKRHHTMCSANSVMVFVWFFKPFQIGQSNSNTYTFFMYLIHSASTKGFPFSLHRIVWKRDMYKSCY